MEIRYLKETDDRYAISEIYERSWKYAYRDIVPEAYLAGILKGQWAQGIDAEGRYTMVMEDGRNIIGTASFCRSRMEEMADCGEVVSIYFLPEYMGKGCGKLLLDAVMGELETMGFKDIFLWVLEENYNARHFYEKYGFEISDRYMENDIGGKRLREVQYCYMIPVKGCFEIKSGSD